jgi:hypothetical protein
MGCLNGMWRGNKVKYGSLHDYVRHHKPKPDECEECKLIKRLDLANISGKYKRDLSDWKWLCRKCHMSQDGRVALRIVKVCKRCGKNFVVKDFLKDSKFCSLKCFHAFINKRVVKICEICESLYTVKNYMKNNSRFCSRKCLNKWKQTRYVGKNNPNYKTGNFMS